ncbi:MAG: SHOCT domain-containing protein [Chlorobi bacterium]|nr:SHOCT domain-containing protein [Chlorobiota bacterium]
MMNGMFGGGMWFSWLFWIILIVVVVWAIIQFGNRNQPTNITNNTERETPLDILKKRYAKGEITKEEYERMKNDLS